MARVDVPKVRGKMAEKGFGIGSLADALEIDRNTMSAYLKNPEKMPYAIVSRMAQLLCDTPEEASSIFFATDLRST